MTPAAAVIHTLSSCGAEGRIPVSVRRAMEAELKLCFGSSRDSDEEEEEREYESGSDGGETHSLRRRLWALRTTVA